MAEKRRSKAVFWQQGAVDTASREAVKGHRGACVWLTGLSASGKSTVAFALEHTLHARGVHTMVLDGDNLRHGLCGDLGFTAEDRAENIRRAASVAGLMVKAGLVVISAFISPTLAVRATARELVPEGRFFEGWVECPIEVCEQRDPKGLYKRARAGEIKSFTGISAPYEAPENPELVLHTGAPDATPGGCVDQIMRLLLDRGIIPA